MIIHDCIQGSPEWHKARSGVITASMFTVARATLKSGASKGQPTEAANNYAFRLAVERISGEPLDEGFETWQMRRGRELEEDCRLLHEADLNVMVDQCGFITTDDSVFGCSADCLIEHERGGGEYKCFVAPEKLRDIILHKDLSTVTDQIQGCMWITGAHWWDFCLYCPALKPANKHYIRHRVARDNEYISALEMDLVRFSKLVDESQKRLLED
jgi:hypothetical protein